MQLMDLVKPIEDCTDEELRERILAIRHKRDVVRPAKRKHEERAAKKGTVGRISKAEDLFNSLSPEQKAEILKQLGG